MKATIEYENGDIGERMYGNGDVAELEQEIAANEDYENVLKVWISLDDSEDVDVETAEPNLRRDSVSEPFSITE